MEFPELGKHCDYNVCNRLDFLPMKCDACAGIFCCDHIKYDLHCCASSYKKDVQVPVCPLCNKPVPTGKNQSPDLTVGEHIDMLCQSDPAKAKRSSHAHHCSVTRCKQFEFVPVVCSECRLNFCLKHRNPLDHECLGAQAAPKQAAIAAICRQKNRTNNGPSAHDMMVASTSDQRINGSMTEDEALARALHLSLNVAPSDSSVPTTSQEELDRRLAEALAQGETHFTNEQLRQRELKKSHCSVS